MDAPLSRTLTYLMIVGGNSFALIGVLLWGWEMFDIFYLYWTVNVITGFVTIIRMLYSASWSGLSRLPSIIFSIAFFGIHYGMFTLVHGIIMTQIMQPDIFDQLTHASTGLLGEFYMLYQLPSALDMAGFAYIFAGILFIECVFGIQKIYDDRKKKQDARAIMFSPYGRIIILHLTILFGGLISSILGHSIFTLIMFVALKTFADIYSFRSRASNDDEADARSPLSKIN